MQKKLKMAMVKVLMTRVHLIKKKLVISVAYSILT